MLRSQLTNYFLSAIFASATLLVAWRFGEPAKASAAPRPGVSRVPRRVDAAKLDLGPPRPPTPTVRPHTDPSGVPAPPEVPPPAKARRQDDAPRQAPVDLEIEVTESAPADESLSTDSSEPDLSPSQRRLRDQIRTALAVYYQRPVNARDHSPWEVFHWIVAYNVDAQILTRGPGGESSTAVGWLCYNNPCRGQRLLTVDRGHVTAQYGVGLEGHPGQFMAILGQSRVMSSYPMRVGGKQFTVADLVETNKLNCNSNKELTFQLIGLAHYLDLDETWKNSAGETWSIPRLIREEISKPIHGSACGGTHRLMGMTYAVRKRQVRGQPIDGEYLRAQVYINDYKKFTLRMQNPDGSFSTEWFSGRGARPDVDRRIQTTGHILEWLIFGSTDEELQHPQIVKAVDYLSETLLQDRHRDWKIGPLGHALRALTLYDRRVFKATEEPATPKTAPPEVARRESSRRQEPIERLPEFPAGISPAESDADSESKSDAQTDAASDSKTDAATDADAKGDGDSSPSAESGSVELKILLPRSP